MEDDSRGTYQDKLVNFMNFKTSIKSWINFGKRFIE